MDGERASIRVSPDGRINAADAARVLGRTAKTLANWRTQKLGPKPIQVGGRIFYDLDEVRGFRGFSRDNPEGRRRH